MLRRTTWRRLGVLGSALGDDAGVHLEIQLESAHRRTWKW